VDAEEKQTKKEGPGNWRTEEGEWVVERTLTQETSLVEQALKPSQKGFERN